MKQINRLTKLITEHPKTVIVLVVLILILVIYGKSQADGQAQPSYQTSRVEKGTIVSSVSASGQVITSGRMPVLSQASGQVKEIYVRNGDTVASGQKILTLTLDPVASQKNAAAWSNYLSAKNTLDTASANTFSLQSALQTAWKKYYDLATSSTYQNSDGSPKFDIRPYSAEFNSAQEDFLAAEAKYKNQRAIITAEQAGLSASWQNYQQTSPDLVAPTAGILQDLTYVPGMLISSSISSSGIMQSQTIASIVTSASPAIAVNLSEVDVNRVKEGDTASLTFDVLLTKTYTGKIVGVNKTGVVSSGVTNYPAIIQLDISPIEVLPNMSASADIILATKNDVLLIPSGAINTRGGQSTVRVVRNGQIVDIPIETGISSDTQTEIVSGLLEGNMVITGNTTPPGTTGQSPFSTFRFGGAGGASTGTVRVSR